MQVSIVLVHIVGKIAQIANAKSSTEAMIHNFYSEYAVLVEESDLWATHGFVSVTHSQPTQTLKFTHSLNLER